MIPDKEYRDIEAYIFGLLPKVRKERFEEKLRNDPAFKAKFDEMYPMITALNSIAEEKRILDILKEDQVETIETTTTLIALNRKIFYFIAAACVLIFGVIFWHDATMDSRMSKGLFEHIGVSQGASIDECPNEDLLNLYFEEKYHSLIEKLNGKKELPCYAFYQGMGYLGLKDVPKAVPLLVLAIQSDNIEIQQLAEWYLSNAYINLHEKEKAKVLLKKIAESSEQHRFKRAANELLIELNKKPLLFKFQL